MSMLVSRFRGSSLLLPGRSDLLIVRFSNHPTIELFACLYQCVGRGGRGVESAKNDSGEHTYRIPRLGRSYSASAYS
jgi:hypothetical protein